MKLSCLPVSFFDDIIEKRISIGQWAEMGASLGLDAIDISILFLPDHSSAYLTQVRNEIEDAGMRVAMVTTYPDFTHPDPNQRVKELELEREAIAVAAEIGAEIVRVTAGQAHPDTVRELGIQWAVKGLHQLMETTRESEIRLVYENHAKPGAWQYTDFSQPPDIFLEIVRRTEDLNLGVNFDTGNATAFAEDPLDLLEQVIDRVISVHASDTQRKGVLQHVLLGTGATPYPSIFSRLKRANWDGWICMEEASFCGREGVKAASDYIRETWQKAQP
jgi:sugar phosphate isomerase/epimerase